VDDLVVAVQSGDRRVALTALRDHLALQLVEGLPQTVAPIAKQLADVLRELEGLAEPKGSAVDDLRARRAARVAGASGS
jgi:hypothetical protein